MCQNVTTIYVSVFFIISEICCHFSFPDFSDEETIGIGYISRKVLNDSFMNNTTWVLFLDLVNLLI